VRVHAAVGSPARGWKSDGYTIAPHGGSRHAAVLDQGVGVSFFVLGVGVCQNCLSIVNSGLGFRVWSLQSRDGCGG